MRVSITWTLTLLASGATALAAQTRGASPLFATRIAGLTSQYAEHPAASPDGRWIVLTTNTTSSSSLGIVASGGGEVRELTPRSDRAWQAAWFPKGDRIAYISDRQNGIVVSDFDTRDGRLTGSPRRVSIERPTAFDISPDGNWIAYIAGEGEARDVKVIPASGGSARTIYHGTAPLRVPHFSADGKDLYFSVVQRPFGREIVRVSTGGGPPAIVRRAEDSPDGSNIVAEPRFNRLLHFPRYDGALVVTTLAGDTTAVIANAGTGDFPQARFGNDPSTLYVALGEAGAVIRAVSLTGSQSYDLSDSKEYYWPVGWSADSKRVFFENGAGDVLYSATHDGRDARTTKFEPSNLPRDAKPMVIRAVSGDGRYWLVMQRQGLLSGRPVYIYDSQSRMLNRVVDSLRVAASVSAPGGNYLQYHYDLNAFVLTQRVGGAGAAVASAPREIIAVSMDGTKRVLRRVPSAADSASSFAMHGDRIAWIQRMHDSTVLFIARGAGAPARAWASAARLSEALWSRDGKTIALLVPQSPVAGRPRNAVVFLAIDANGGATVTGQSATFAEYWDIFWSPDGASLTALEYPGTGYDTRLIRIPVNGGATSYILNQGQATFWDHYVSPDGAYTLIPAEIARGTSLWKIDLKAAEAAYAQRGRR
jgi:Tol biopolymer transport system component